MAPALPLSSKGSATRGAPAAAVGLTVVVLVISATAQHVAKVLHGFMDQAALTRVCVNAATMSNEPPALNDRVNTRVRHPAASGGDGDSKKKKSVYCFI
jgi:hypothetical protein